MKEMEEIEDSEMSQRLIQLQRERGDIEDDVDVKRPKEPWRGEYVKSVVYAGLDAIVTCFSLISSISAIHRSSGKIKSKPFCYFV